MCSFTLERAFTFYWKIFQKTDTHSFDWTISTSTSKFSTKINTYYYFTNFKEILSCSVFENLLETLLGLVVVKIRGYSFCFWKRIVYCFQTNNLLFVFISSNVKILHKKSLSLLIKIISYSTYPKESIKRVHRLLRSPKLLFTFFFNFNFPEKVLNHDNTCATPVEKTFITNPNPVKDKVWIWLTQKSICIHQIKNRCIFRSLPWFVVLVFQKKVNKYLKIVFRFLKASGTISSLPCCSFDIIMCF